MRYITELADSGQLLEVFQKEDAHGIISSKKARINILALGDVGSTLLLGLKLLGGDVIESIGIYDLNSNLSARFEMEMNQLDYPFGYEKTPRVYSIEKGNLFDCDIFLFCATKAVPAIGSEATDVRMVQLAENAKIVREYAALGKEAGFEGLFAVISDPVDQLCAAAAEAGLKRSKIQGFGLGVMHSRAMEIARNDMRFKDFFDEIQVFGPHGADLIAVNSVSHYDEALSDELTKLTASSNLKIRAVGYKPYIAPAIASGAFSIILMLRGEWYYSSIYLGTEADGAFFGIKKRFSEAIPELEALPIPDLLFEKIQTTVNKGKHML